MYYYEDNGEWQGPFSEICNGRILDAPHVSPDRIFVPVYNYSFGYVYETLKERQLLISKISGLIDPYEFLFIDEPASDDVLLCKLENDSTLTEEQKNRCRTPENLQSIRERFTLTPKQIRDMADSNYRIRSFAQYSSAFSESEILLWSHYANKHQGIRIGYKWYPSQVTPYFIEKVSYDERICINTNSKEFGTNNHSRDQIMPALCRKCSVWQYENEIRLLTFSYSKFRGHIVDMHKKSIFSLTTEITLPRQRIFDQSDRTFLSFEPENVFSIDFGCRFSVDRGESEREYLRKDFIELVQSDYPHATVREAVLSNENWDLAYITLHQQS